MQQIYKYSETLAEKQTQTQFLGRTVNSMQKKLQENPNLDKPEIRSTNKYKVQKY